MSFKKTLIGIAAIPIALTLAYSSANYATAKIQGRDASAIVAPDIAGVDPVILVGTCAGLYYAPKDYRRKKSSA